MSRLDAARCRNAAAAIAAALLVLMSSRADAQVFPPDSEWVPLMCGGGVMFDLHQDQTGALGPRDIIGNDAFPAGYRAADTDFLYLRLRLDTDPTQGTDLRPFAWGMEIDIDADTTTYEVLVLADGVSDEVTLYRNTTTTLPNDPNDPADLPAIAANPYSTHGQVTVAADGSSFGGDPDHFLDFAIAWADAMPLGLAPTTPVIVWAASSSNQNSLNGDFACHDGASGSPTLDGIASDPTVLDPDRDTDGDGFTDVDEIAAGTDPNDPNDFPMGPPPSGDGRLEGGGGCSVDAGASLRLSIGSGLPLIGLLFFCVLGRAGRSRRSRRRRTA